ncbi:MAG: hypothetical protein AB9882_03165 [Ignavibacteriaceae bacterium]
MKNIAIIILILTVSTFSQTLTLSEMKSAFRYNEEGVTKVFDEKLVTTKSEKKNPALAILFSMMLPGMGELYAGNYSSGQYFTIAEAAFIGMYFGVNSYGNWKKDNYQSFAGSSGGVNSTGKNDEYYARIGEYKDVEQYNNIKALNREFEEMYDPSLYYWKWQKDEDRENYRDMWLSSQHAYNNLRFVVGAMLLNRLVSTINAVRSVTAFNKSLENKNESGLYFNANPNPNAVSSFSVNFYTAF